MRHLPAEEILLEARPLPTVTLVWLFTKALPLAFSITFPVAFFTSVIFNQPEHRGAQPPLAWSSVFLLVAVAFAIVLLCVHLYNSMLARTYVYYVTNQRIVIEGGILRRTAHAVEHRCVTDVQLSQNLAEQLLSLGTVNLSTPGTANAGLKGKSRSMPELHLEGLADVHKVFDVVANCVRSTHGPDV